VYSYNDFGFTFTVDREAKIPEELINLFHESMSSIDKDLIDYYSTLIFDKEHSFLLRCEDEPIGYAKICENNNYSLLVEIFVKYEFRQLSLGTFILNSIRKYVKSINSILRTITLPSDRVAKNFYEASGITARVLLMEEKRENTRYRP
tara:strand:+ start:138 stop:581 length:444 start_codon:yes stop_codon:yes gene_type:complete